MRWTTTTPTARLPEVDESEETAVGSSEAPVELRPVSNAAPAFGDQDAETAGVQNSETTRMVDENVAGASVGGPVSAGDSDNDLLVYTVSGADAGLFKITPKTGQLETKVKLDYEASTSHTVMVTATDPSGATASIMVNVMVVDKDDKATISIVTGDDGNGGTTDPDPMTPDPMPDEGPDYDADEDGEISREEAVQAVNDYFDDEITREEVIEVINLYLNGNG